MASTETAPEIIAPAVAKAGLSLIPLVLTVLGAVMLALAAAGGTAFWLYKSGHLGPADAHTAAAKAAPEKVKAALAEVALEPVLVNLGDAGSQGYLRAAVTLVVEEKLAGKSVESKPEKGKAHNEYEAAERDALLDVLGRQTSEALLAPDGKQHVKEQIRAALKQRVPDVAVHDVLFTDFLVQR